MTDAGRSLQLFRLLTRLHPELWELFHPHVPSVGVAERYDLSAIDAHALPPVVRISRTVRWTAGSVAQATIAADLAGRDAGDILREIADDWCGTGSGHRIPWPRRWPVPWPPGEPYPIDPKALTASVQAEAGLVFQSYADSIADERLSGAFAELADRLTTSALEVGALDR
ncbi:hypothetical protein OG871_29030 [Kitasatospora sp. NBC_00374]|uniref:hypothetical protein n=1 Tax=Kitasatospora sp. NBC_00374 TaxID=2975964 RepID=UPI0030E280E1